MMYPLNYLGIVVTALMIFAIGALWYGLLFGRQWIAAHGYTPEQLEGMKQGMARTYFLSFLCYLVLAAVMDYLIVRLGIDTPQGGVKLGAALWAGFVATVGFTAYLYSNKRLATWLLDASYQLVFMVAAGVLLAVW
ncbi:MAG TPA: DUF1761 domain-containing protein [Gemmatimonadales bacterium]